MSFAKVTLVSIPPPGEKSEIAPPSPFVAELPAKVSFVNVKVVASAWMAPPPARGCSTGSTR